MLIRDTCLILCNENSHFDLEIASLEKERRAVAMKKYQHLSQKERLKLYDYSQMGISISEIADKLNRSRSTISQELKRNRIGSWYLLDTAQKLYVSRYPGRPQKINPDTAVYHYIRYKLKSGWSPEQISGRMKVENKPYYVCHETIYQYIYRERQGKDWYACLAHAKSKRGKRKGRKLGLENIIFAPFIIVHQRL